METVKSGGEISYLFKQGKRASSPYLTLIVLKPQHDRAGRVAFIAGKKIGKAVWRNKAKRRMRALCRDLQGPWVDYDVIFLAKSALNTASYSKVLTTCDTLLVRVFS